MKDKTLFYIIIIIIIIFIVSLTSNNICSISPSGKEYFSDKDKKAGDSALKKLENMLSRGEKIPEISDEDLIKIIEADEVYIAKIADEPNLKNGREGMKYFRSENTRLWPYYYYSQPYNPESGGGAWPKGMYSRLRNWSPGFYTTGFWQHHMRPGMGYKYWPRNRWVRHQTQGRDSSYYYLGNGDDWTHRVNSLPSNVGIRYLGGS